MSEHVYKIIELSGSSKTGIEDAINKAIARAGESVRNMRWFEVKEVRGQIEAGRTAFWQVIVKIGFNVENAGNE